jgi:mannose-1-phosphate guanylyltransferase/mannose-6-phosphate isomerase
MKIFPVILSGGLGKRLWPISRGEFPKQYHSLEGPYSLLQNTIMRLEGMDNVYKPIVICNSDHRFIVAEQLLEINISNPTILLEPVSRNTAPAIAAAAIHIMQDKKNIDSIMLVLSADHDIRDVEAFHNSVNIAINDVAEDKFAVFGIVPNNPNTEYGYIQSEARDESPTRNVKAFTEKPSLDLAKKYLRENSELNEQKLPISWLWNSGIFMFKTNLLLSELSIQNTSIVNAITESVRNAKSDLDFIRLEEESFASSPNISIDYALMEKSKNLIMVPLDAQWSDLGSWNTLYDIGEKDQNNNTIKGNVLAQKTTNSYIHSTHHVIATIGIDRLVVVATSDEILIANQNNINEVKSIFDKFEAQGHNKEHPNTKVYRPWGWYESIEYGKNFQVKKLHVKSGARLSLQKHYKRAEHWVVVSGVATVHIENETFILNEGQSTHINIGVVHSLENNTDKILEVIEVQNGLYLGEDDIKRFEDIYGRN